MDCVAIIPAKGHSTRLPRKNFLECAGVPLWRRAVECALEAKIFSGVWFSSDDLKANAEVYRGGRCWVMDRPPYYSDEGVSVAAVVSGLLGHYGHTYGEMPTSFCVLWPTTPTRTPEVLRAMGERFEGDHLDSLHSVQPMPLYHEGTAIFMRTLTFLQRLSLDWEPGIPYWMTGDAVDVNTAEDLARAEAIILAREAACPSSS